MTNKDIMKMLLEIEDGRAPTPEEVESLQKFITDVSAQFAKISEMMVEAYAMLARNLLDWWESIPMPLRVELMALSEAPLQERKEALPSLIDNMPRYDRPTVFGITAETMPIFPRVEVDPLPLQFPDQSMIMRAEAERRDKFRL